MRDERRVGPAAGPDTQHRHRGLTSDERRLGLAAGLDTFVIVLFVAIGLRNHDRESTFEALVETSLPFLAGLAAAWAIVRAWRRPTRVVTGLAIWPITVLGAMIGRQLIGDGTATSFVAVATLFLGAFLVGWRLVLRGVERRRGGTRPVGVD